MPLQQVPGERGQRLVLEQERRRQLAQVPLQGADQVEGHHRVEAVAVKPLLGHDALDRYPRLRGDQLREPGLDAFARWRLRHRGAGGRRGRRQEEPRGLVDVEFAGLDPAENGSAVVRVRSQGLPPPPFPLRPR